MGCAFHAGDRGLKPPQTAYTEDKTPIMIKTILKTIGGLLLIVLLLLMGIWFFVNVNPEQQLVWQPGTRIDSTFIETDFDAAQVKRLKALYGKNKIIPRSCELEALLALSHFPELKDTHIKFYLLETFDPLASRPDITSLFGSREDRRYNIFISTRSDPVLFKNLPFDPQIAIIAHELGHTVYYQRHSLLEIITFGLEFLTNIHFQAQHEKTTDALVVYKGLGWQIHNYAEYTRTSEKTRELYQMFGENFIDKFYLTHHELKDIILKIPDYNGREHRRVE